MAAHVLEHAGLQELVRGAGPGLHGGDLLLRPRPRVPRAAVIARLGDGVVGLHDFLLITEVADLLLQLGELLLELLFLLGQFLVLRLHPVDLLLGGGLAGQRLPGQVFPALSERGLGLVPQVRDRLPQLRFLKLESLAFGGDLDQCLADPGDVVEHLLVGVVQRLVRVLNGVKRLVSLGREDVVGSGEKTHDGLLLAMGLPPGDGLSHQAMGCRQRGLPD